MRHGTKVGPSRVFSDPEFFPVRLDAAKGTLAFVRAKRSRLSELSFLDGRLRLSDLEPFEVSIASLLEAAPPEGARDRHFIFHSGFCGSTLFARCLDRTGACLALKEPGLLSDLSEAKRLGLSLAREEASWRRVLSLSLRLLFRPFAARERIIVKASSADNGLLGDILGLNPATKVLILSTDLKSFLLAVAKGGKSRRAFIRRLLSAHAADGELAALFPVAPSRISALDDLKAAAVLWRLQDEIFANAARTYSCASLLVLESGAFLADPERTLARANAFFGLPAFPGKRERAALGRILARHAKSPAFRYDADIRAAEFRAIEAYLGSALPETLAWEESISGKKKLRPLVKAAS